MAVNRHALSANLQQTRAPVLGLWAEGPAQPQTVKTPGIDRHLKPSERLLCDRRLLMYQHLCEMPERVHQYFLKLAHAAGVCATAAVHLMQKAYSILLMIGI